MTRIASLMLGTAALAYMLPVFAVSGGKGSAPVAVPPVAVPPVAVPPVAPIGGEVIPPVAVPPANTDVTLATPTPSVDAAADAKPKSNRASNPVLTDIVADIAIPTKRLAAGRNGLTIYPFEKLEVGQSFGIKDRTYKSMASTISSANKRNEVEDLDTAGAKQYVQVDKKKDDGKVALDAAGNAIKVNVVKMKSGKVFLGMAVDPTTDPQGASVRVWRKA